MDNKPQRVADYFVVAGLGSAKRLATDVDGFGDIEQTADIIEPITDVTVIFKSLGEYVPLGYKCIDKTPAGFTANLNHGSIRQPTCFLCIRRGRDKVPLTDIGVLFEGKERLMSGCDVVLHTHTGRPANVNNSGGSKTFITYRRASEQMAHNSLAVTDICVILKSKDEKPPRAFFMINRNLNKGMVGSDVYLCYRKSLAKPRSVTYHPEIISRFPSSDYEGFPLPASVPMFCLPQGAVVECWPEKTHHPLPSFSTFVLTGASGQKIYGAAVTFFELLPEENLTEVMRSSLKLDEIQNSDENRPLAHTNKCISLLSHWPFFEAFKKFLSHLYRILMSVQPIPIERYIATMMIDVPFPSPQRPRILVQTNLYDPFEICQPYHSPLPVSGASYTRMLRYLGPENCVLMFHLLLTEHKVLIHSLRPAFLTSVAEAIVTVLFPFNWECPYIPLCPLALNDVLCAPLPFIVGIDSRYFDQYDPPDDVTCIDLDNNRVFLASVAKDVNSKSLPKKPGKVLFDRLTELYCQLYKLYHKEKETSGSDITETAIELAPLDHDSTFSRRMLSLEVAVQEAFLRFMGSILKGYGSYLNPITSAPTEGTCDLNSLFDLQGFLKTRPNSQHKFFQTLTKTQMFCHFIEQRSFLTSQDSLLAFFDDCLERLDSTEPLIELDDNISRDGQRTYVVTPPDASKVERGKMYSYSSFPVLNADLIKPGKSLLNVHHSNVTPPISPAANRTKPERVQSSLIAKKNAGSPREWAKCLVAHCYSLWFVHLPAYIKSHHNQAKVLHVAFEIMCKMQTERIKLPDEVCYRVLMQLCGQYGHPALAVKVLFEMKQQGIIPNAVTYGHYNKAVMEGKWPSNSTSAFMWNKVRIVFSAVYEFRKGARLKTPSGEGLMSPSGSSSDLDGPESPRRSMLRKAERPRTPSREREVPRTPSRDPSRERLLVDESADVKTPLSRDRDFRGHRERRFSEMSVTSESLDTLDTSMDASPAMRRQTYRSISESSFVSTSDGSQLFINPFNEDTEQSEPYGYTTEMMDDVLFGLPSGLQRDTALEALICTCYQCVKCGRYLYDEEIMAGWAADDSTLTTNCPFCKAPQVATLTVKVKDYRNCFSSKANSEISSSLESLELNVGTPECTENGSMPVSSSAPVTIECNLMMQRLGVSPRQSGMGYSPPVSNPVPIRSRGQRNPHRSISAPCSANASPTGSFHGSPRNGSWFLRPGSFTSTRSNSSIWYVTRPPEQRDAITVAYLNPLVLRKELENMFENDGVDALHSPDIVHQKSIIFWNLVWYFKRLELPSFLPSHLLGIYPSNEKTEKLEERRSSIVGTQVLVSTSWDGDKPEFDMVPLYLLWNAPAADQQGSVMDRCITPRSVLESVVLHIKRNDVYSPAVILLDERTRQKNAHPCVKWSIYRELLFLALTACGSEQIDVDAFDREYRRSYQRLWDSKNYSDLLCPEDKPPTTRITYCRRTFRHPLLQPKLPQYLTNTQNLI